MKFEKAFLGIFSVIVVHIFALIVGLYGKLPWWDIPMHFFGGFVMAMLAIAIHGHMTTKGHVKKVSEVYHVIFILGFTMLIAVAWEFHEYLIDNTIGPWYGWEPTQLSLGDTMLDLLLGGIGGLVAAYTFKKHW